MKDMSRKAPGLEDELLDSLIAMHHRWTWKLGKSNEPTCAWCCVLLTWILVPDRSSVFAACFKT